MKDTKSSQKIIISVLVLLLITMSNAFAVEISQVVYAPAGSDKGGEAVELFNFNNRSVDISGWALRTEASDADATIPADIVLSPYSRYLIADTGWSEARDDLLWREADHEETLTLANADAGVALVDSNGLIVDAVGWGVAEDIEEGLYTGTPIAGGSGSIVRVNRTGNNSMDFKSVPAALATGTPVIVEVSKPRVTIEGISLPDDIDGAGIQWMPLPGRDKRFSVKVNISGGSGRVTFGDEGCDLRENNSVWSCDIYLPFDMPPGSHKLVVSAGEESASQDVEVLAVKGISIESGMVRLGVGSASDLGVKNAGNIPLSLAVSATRLSSGKGTIGPGAISFSPDNQHFFGLTEVTQDVGVSIEPGGTQAIYFAFEPAFNAPPGTYSGSIAISTQ